ncbi:MAG TPA: hypothetical protein VFI39_06425 [Gemmatimonadales bacterium]|nr:hypothetical protein [Gemmatimonadales bacterium]
MPASPRHGPGPLLLGGGAAIVFALGLGLGYLAAGDRGRAAPAPMPSESVAPPDISNLSPRERFDRLYDRVMRAASSGDEATVQRFGPMAVAAYGMLDSVNDDARYDAALLQIHLGDVADAKVLADQILQHTPTHLFGLMIRGTLARAAHDTAAARRNERLFLGAYDKEIAKGRPEYAAHRSALDAFRAQARDDLK